MEMSCTTVKMNMKRESYRRVTLSYAGLWTICCVRFH